MSFVWDEEKERRNVAKHKISFAEAITVFDDSLFVIAADDDHSLAQKRFIILGESTRGRLLVVGYAERGKDTRIINA